MDCGQDKIKWVLNEYERVKNWVGLTGCCRWCCSGNGRRNNDLTIETMNLVRLAIVSKHFCPYCLKFGYHNPWLWQFCPNLTQKISKVPTYPFLDLKLWEKKIEFLVKLIDKNTNAILKSYLFENWHRQKFSICSLDKTYGLLNSEYPWILM